MILMRSYCNYMQQLKFLDGQLMPLKLLVVIKYSESHMLVSFWMSGVNHFANL